MSNSLLQEVRNLDLDLREIYGEFGTPSIQLCKYIKPTTTNIYGEGVGSYSEPINLLGRIRIDVGSEEQIGIGRKEDIATFTFYVVRSVLKEQGVEDVTPNDKLIYLGVELNILSVQPTTVLGDYALQYKIIAQGKAINNPHFEPRG